MSISPRFSTWASCGMAASRGTGIGVARPPAVGGVEDEAGDVEVGDAEAVDRVAFALLAVLAAAAGLPIFSRKAPAEAGAQGGGLPILSRKARSAGVS